MSVATTVTAMITVTDIVSVSVAAVTPAVTGNATIYRGLPTSSPIITLLFWDRLKLLREAGCLKSVKKYIIMFRAEV